MYTVYSKPNCPDCNTVKKLLQNYEEIDITQSPEALQRLSELGLRQLPQVFLDGKLIGNLLKTKQHLDSQIDVTF